MYHFSNQPFYHQSSYEQSSLFVDNVKNYNIAPTCQSITEFQSDQNQLESLTQSKSGVYLGLQESPGQEQKSGIQAKSSINNEEKEKRKPGVDTSNFTVEERLVAAVWVHERKRTKSSMTQIKRDFRTRFGREAPAKNTLIVWERKLFSTGSVCDAPRPGRPINRQNHVEEVSASVRSAPGLSLRARALALRVPRTTLRTILHKDLQQTKVKNTGTNKVANDKIKKKVKKITCKKSVNEQGINTKNMYCSSSAASSQQYMLPNYI